MYGKFADDTTIHGNSANSEYKQVEEGLPELEEKLHLILESVDEGIIVTDLAGNIKHLNSTAVRLHGYNDKQELVGRNAFELIAEKHRSRATENVKRIIDKGGTRNAGYTLLTMNGREFPGEIRTSVLKDLRGNPEEFIIFVKDITGHKLIKAQLSAYRRKLRSLISRLSLSEEHERQRIAAQVHDRVNQTLALCRMKLGALAKSAPSPHFAEQLDEINHIIRQLIEEIRSFTFELGSPLLYELGFEKAVEHLTKQVQEDHGILANFEDDGEPKPLGDDIRVLLFQIVRELLSNVVRHAQACNVHVYIQRQGSDIFITVEDDGVGFDTRKITSGSNKSDMGFGLFSIRERLSYLDRQLRIESEPGYGTRITVVAPLRLSRIRTRA